MRTSKSQKYAIEQFLIQKEIISLLNLEDGFYLYELDRDSTKQQRIMDMVPEIWQYFAHMNVTGLLYPEKCKRPWLSIVRGVLKNRYNLKYKACRYLSKDGSVFTMKYHIQPLESQMKKSGSADNLSYEEIENDSGESLSDSESFSSSEEDDLSSKLTLRLKKKKNSLKLKLRYRPKQTKSHKNQRRRGDMESSLTQTQVVC